MVCCARGGGRRGYRAAYRCAASQLPRVLAVVVVPPAGRAGRRTTSACAPAPPSLTPRRAVAAAALSWLRRRGPPLPEAALHKLFRQEAVRLFDPASQRVTRAAKGRALPPGALLLIPKAALAQEPPPVETGTAAGAAPTSASASAAAVAPRVERARREWAARLRSSGLLHVGPDWLALNKPAGLACQGGSGVSVSLDTVMDQAFSDHLLPAPQPAAAAWPLPPPRQPPQQLRLVHRLDRETTGALLIARGPDAAAWLAAAFKGASSSSSSGGDSSGGALGGARVSKTYWAVVGTGRRLPPRGSIDLPVAVAGGREAVLQAAHTTYRVLHQGGPGGLAWLELRPVTGRKHQLRLHCLHGLGAAILGDRKYAALRSPAQQAPLAALQQRLAAAAAAKSSSSVSGDDYGGGWPPLFLHCRQLEVRRPVSSGLLASKRSAAAASVTTVVTAPLPAAWQELLALQGWPLPDAKGEAAM